MILSIVLLYSILKPYRCMSMNVMNNLNIRFCLLLSVFALGSIFIQFQEALFGSIILFLTTIVYGLNILFILIHTPIFKFLSSKLNQEIEIDQSLLSPDFDFRNEVIRRVWHEGLCTLLLGMPEYRIPEGKILQWSEEFPGAPYLLHFAGSHGERLAENLKVLRAIGPMKYQKATQISLRKDRSIYKELALQRTISSNFVGPDCFWKPRHVHDLEGVTTFFGRSDVVPFPFKVIFKYDQYHSPICISRIEDLKLFVAQNQNRQVMMRRQVRLLLRAMDNREVFAPISISWDIIKPQSGWLRWIQKSRSDITFRTGLLKINRNCQGKWKGYNYNSGFEVSIRYKDGQSLKSDGSTINQISYTRVARSIGLRDDFIVTPALAKIFQDNHSIIKTTIEKTRIALESHRSFFSKQAIAKQNKMSFSFLEVFRQDQDISSLPLRLQSHLKLNEVDEKLRLLPQTCRGSLKAMEERMKKINKSKLNQWWFVIFDDIYRRNYRIIKKFSNKPEDFSPYYPSSICYKPMGRDDLEKFLIERNLLRSTSKTDSQDAEFINSKRNIQKPNDHLFHSGFLNSIYLHLDIFLFKDLQKQRKTSDSSITMSETYKHTNCLPRSKLYQAVYDQSQCTDSLDEGFFGKLKSKITNIISLEKLSADWQKEDNEGQDACKDGECGSEITTESKLKKFIKLSQHENLIKFEASPHVDYNSVKIQPASSFYDHSKAHHRSTSESKSNAKPSFDHDSFDCSHVDVNARDTDGCDITDGSSLNTESCSEKTSSTIYGFC